MYNLCLGPSICPRLLLHLPPRHPTASISICHPGTQQPPSQSATRPEAVGHPGTQQLSQESSMAYQPWRIVRSMRDTPVKHGVSNMSGRCITCRRCKGRVEATQRSPANKTFSQAFEYPARRFEAPSAGGSRLPLQAVRGSARVPRWFEARQRSPANLAPKRSPARTRRQVRQARCFSPLRMHQGSKGVERSLRTGATGAPPRAVGQRS